MLEVEAKKQLADEGVIYGPIVTKVKEKDKMPDPSNLPYLHKNPAI